MTLSDDARAAAAGAPATGDIAENLVDLRLAKYQNAASVAVLRTADEMTRDLISLGKRG